MNNFKIENIIYKGTSIVESKITIPKSYLKSTLWIGLYSKFTKEDTNYLEMKYITKEIETIKFKHLLKGLYELRLFEDKSTLFIRNGYNKLFTSKEFRIGDDEQNFSMTCEFNNQNSSLINVYYTNHQSIEDFICLYKKSDSNTKHYILKESVHLTETKMMFNISKCHLDSVKNDIDNLEQEEYHFRYYCNESYSKKIAFAESNSFTFSFPKIQAIRISKDYIKIHFENNHLNIWVGLFQNKYDKEYLTYETIIEENNYISLKYPYQYNEHYYIKLFSHSKQLLAYCTLDKNNNYP